MEWIKALVVLVVAVAGVMGDTPANCTFDDIKGEWMIYETERMGDSSIDCDNMGRSPGVYSALTVLKNKFC